jgi:hypothetical protein
MCRIVVVMHYHHSMRRIVVVMHYHDSMRRMRGAILSLGMTSLAGSPGCACRREGAGSCNTPVLMSNWLLFCSWVGFWFCRDFLD